MPGESSKRLKLAMLALLGCVSSPLPAVTEMAFHGTLIEPPPCSINNGEDVHVPFGDSLGVEKIDGVNYRMPVEAFITCQLGAAMDSLVMIFTGQQTAFDASAVVAIQQQTGNGTDLGVRLYSDGVPVTFDQPLPVDPYNPPYIEAVPVKLAGATLSEGSFTAIATIRVEYQ